MRSPARLSLLGIAASALVVSSCAAARDDATRAPTTSTTPPPPVASASEPAAPAPPVASASAPQPAAAPPVQLVNWERRLDKPIASFALGKKREAALGQTDGRFGPAWIFDRDKLVEAPIPDRLLAPAAQRDDLRVHFGRDDWPRIFGSRFEGAGARGVYLRHKSGWNADRGEIARLLQPPDAAFFGIIGHDDPEVVCEVGDLCIIKRVSGWTMVPAGGERLHVELSGGVAWGLGEKSLARMTDRGWERVGGEAPWKSAAGVWASAGGEDVWVSEPGADALHRFDGRAWTRDASVVSGPRGLWGSARDDVWLAGSGGVARYDGKGWQRVATPEGSFAEVRGRGPREIWIAGPAGLWRGTR